MDRLMDPDEEGGAELECFGLEEIYHDPWVVVRAVSTSMSEDQPPGREGTARVLCCESHEASRSQFQSEAMTAETVAGIPDVRPAVRGARVPRWLIPVVVLLAAGGTIGFLQVRKQLELNRLIAGLGEPNRTLRARNCYRLARLDPMPRSIKALSGVLRSEKDPEVAEAAGYALQRYKHPPALPLIAEAIDRVSPAPAVAKLISYYARLGGDQTRSKIEAFSNSEQLWWRMGSGIALLELGDVRGAEILLEFAASGDPEVRSFAADSLRRYSEPVTEMVGEYLDLSTAPGAGFSDVQLSALTEFWSGRDRTRELIDSLTWDREKNPSRRAVQRLLHAREKAARWVGLGE